MNQSQKNKLNNTLNIYLKEIHKIYIGNDFREESFYSPLKTFIEQYSQFILPEEKADVVTNPKKIEIGLPDFRVKKSEEIIGYIEAKLPGEDLTKIEKSEQLKRYRTFPNLILTDFLEFRLYKDGNLANIVKIGDLTTLQDLKPIPKNIETFFEFLKEFFSFSIPAVRTSSQLSIELASRTSFLDSALEEELKKNNKEVIRFYKAFQDELIKGLTKERFADLYAQTITYGLFAARMSINEGEFKKDTAWKFIPENLPLLRDIFYSLAGPHFPKSLSWVVDEISQILKKADIPSILKEFKTTTWEKDPVIDFYQTFLATYNPEERKKLGVYYTPLPVVSYIVRSIHKLLKDKFDKDEGLANRDVTLLDPAAGTLTFVVQAIKQVKNELQKRNKAGLIKSYIEEHIIPHFYAFEILVAPYTVGHFKVSMVLKEMGYKFREDERFKFYLTNTLETGGTKEGMSPLFPALAEETQKANEVKEKIPILVILGNPPYAVSSENKSEFIEKLMEDYKEDVRKERNIQPLSDDYIKFIRFNHWKIEQAGKGIVGIISNNSYLSSVIHRGMRKKLLETFDEIYILNLHGSSRIGEKTPEGNKDENVFDIQQGVAIVLYVKLEKSLENKKVYYADLWGLRNEKYKYVFESDIESTKWQELKSKEPYYFFVPKDFTLQEEYEKAWKVTDIFKKWSSGVKTHRDHFVVGFTKEEIIGRLRIFNSNLSDELVKERLKLKDTGSWKLSKERQKIKGKEIDNEIYPYAYRAFDTRQICYEPSLIDRDRLQFMKHLLKENLTLITTRKISMHLPFSHISVENKIGDIRYIVDYEAQAYFFPLYLYPDEPKEKSLIEKATKPERTPNFTTEFLQAIKSVLGTEPTPEDIFYYIYAVLYSPTYRKRYKEFLKIDFPRIPLPKDHEQCEKLSELGKELVDLHLLKHPLLNETSVGFPESGSNRVEKIRYDEENKKVYFNKTQHFEGISKEVWEYRIGAYQVMDKYLKDRKKRALSLDEIQHYMKMAKAIKLTIELQEKINEVTKEI